MTRAEERHLDGLAGDHSARQEYLTVLRSRRAAAEENLRRAGESYARSALVTVAACLLLPPAVAFGTLVFLFGPALAAAHHLAGDWGEVDEDDRAENDLSLREGFRLLSAYRTKHGVKFWVITEADRSATTVLLPSEY